jgi:hypothetical protein
MALITFKRTIAADHHLPHRPPAPIKGGDPHCYSPHHLLSFPPPSKLKHCHHRDPFALPHHHRRPATTPSLELRCGPRWVPYASLSLLRPHRQAPVPRIDWRPCSNERTTTPRHPSVRATAGPRWTIHLAVVHRPWTRSKNFPIEK